MNKIKEMAEELNKIRETTPVGVQMMVFPLEDIEKHLQNLMNNPERAELTAGLLKASDVDVSLFTSGLSKEDRTYFLNLLGLQIVAAKNYAVGASLAILLKKYLIPMAERKQALEKMIIALGGEKENGND